LQAPHAGASLAETEDAVRSTVAVMNEASRAVLAGVELVVDADVICYPNRFRDDGLWDAVARIVEELEAEALIGTKLSTSERVWGCQPANLP
jgi:hypothetical protein